MKTYFKKDFLKVGALSIILFLSGCGKKNPIMTDENINILKNEVQLSRTFETEASNPSTNCPPYLANPSNHSKLKNECGHWSQRKYKMIMNKGVLPPQTTFDQFTDPDLWKILLPK